MQQPSTTFVYCVESGYFEAQTILAIECLRKFGGCFAECPVLAVTPRQGPTLTAQTLKRFAELGVTYIRHDMKHPDSWYCYMNKALAAMLADEYAKTDQIIWMDSDTLVVQEPELLWLKPGVDFAICSTDKNVGSSGPEDKNEAYWQALCDYYGIAIDQLPWIMTEYQQQKVRFRLHSGVYAYRRSTGLGKAFVEACEKMISSRIGYSRELPFPGDDVALSFAVVMHNLNWQLLPISYNYEILPESPTYHREKLSNCQVLHYHYAATSPETTQWLLQELWSELPEVAQWLKARIPLEAKVGGVYRSLLRRLLKEWRLRQQKKIEAACQITVL